MGSQLSGGSCSERNFSGKNVRGEKVQGAIVLLGISWEQLSKGKIFMGNCPGSKNMGEIVLGVFHRDQSSGV